MSPLFKKRWKIFKNNRHAYIALVLFLFIFIVSLFAPILANDKPLFVWYKGNAYFPILTNYTDEFFGGSLPTYADYKDAFTKKEIEKNGFMIMPPLAFSYDTINYDLKEATPSAPTFQNPLGTDDQGRDVLARLLYGIRISILFGLILTFFSSVVGIFAGAIQGYFAGKVDLFFQRFLEIWGSLPQMFILIIVSSVLLPSFWTLLLILLLFSWTGLVGVVRAEFLRSRNFDYVNAARALGVSDIRIMLRHILPNALVASTTYIPFILSGGIVALTALDFLGFGLPSGSPSMGELVRQGKDNLTAPWLGLSAFISMAILLSCLVFIAEGIRTAFDPRQKRITSSGFKIIKTQDKQTLLSIQNLNVYFDKKHVIKDVSFDIPKGKIVALVGESGSGKSVTSLAILGVLQNAFVQGSIKLNGQELIGLSDKKMCAIRGRKIALIFQEPMTSLNPLHKIKKQIIEVIKIHSLKNSQKHIYELLDLVGITHNKERILNSYPHQLSGGERQRVMIAMALAGKPELLIADEPTTALDVVLQKQVLDLMKDLQKKLNLSILFISHDEKTVAYMADKIYKMQDGKIHPLTSNTSNIIFKKQFNRNNTLTLQAQNLSVFYGNVEALKPVNFNLHKGETLGIIGESGSGKTTLANALLRLIPAQGNVILDEKDILNLSQKQFTFLRKDIQIVFQDPFSSLNPRMTVEQIIAEGLKVHYPQTDFKKAVIDVLKQVDLSKDFMMRYPHELSGGQRQRVSIARALILRPKVLVLDEPTSALDAKNRHLILSLLDKIQKQTNVAYLLITHDMNVIAQMADEVMVLKQGICIEKGSANQILKSPKDEYTKKLIKASFL